MSWLRRLVPSIGLGSFRSAKGLARGESKGISNFMHAYLAYAEARRSLMIQLNNKDWDNAYFFCSRYVDIALETAMLGLELFARLEKITLQLEEHLQRVIEMLPQEIRTQINPKIREVQEEDQRRMQSLTENAMMILDRLDSGGELMLKTAGTGSRIQDLVILRRRLYRDLRAFSKGEKREMSIIHSGITQENAEKLLKQVMAVDKPLQDATDNIREQETDIGVTVGEILHELKNFRKEIANARVDEQYKHEMIEHIDTTLKAISTELKERLAAEKAIQSTEIRGVEAAEQVLQPT